MRVTTLLLAGWILVPMLGCASLQDATYELSQRTRTSSAWRSLPDCAKQSCNPRDYQRGWKDGFYDVTTGGTGCPPVVAPPCFWLPSQIVRHCDNRRNAYYSGFQDGAAHAIRFPDTHHLKAWGSCDCPLPSCQNCPESSCGCPIGSCGMSTAPEPTAPEPTEMVTEAPLPMINGAEMLESTSEEPVALPADQTVAEQMMEIPSPPQDIAAVPANDSVTAELAQLEPAALPVTKRTWMATTVAATPQTMPAIVATSAPIVEPVPTTSTPSAAAETSTVIQATPLQFEPMAAEGTVQLASEFEFQE